MTVLERARRRSQKGAFVHRKSPLTKQFFVAARERSKSTPFHQQVGVTPSSERYRRPWQRFLFHRRQQRRSSSEPLQPTIEIKMKTYRWMQAEVLDRIEQGNGRSCTLFDAIEAMKSSPKIMESHAHDPTDSFCGALWKFYRGGGAVNSTKRKYELMGVLDDIETRPSACDDRVTSWEEVEEVLRQYMNFPNEEAVEEDAVYSDDPVERMKQRIELDSLEPVQRRLEAVRQMQMERPPLATEMALKRAEQAVSEKFSNDEHVDNELLRVSEESFLKEEREAEAQERALQLLRILTPEEQQKVQNALFGVGPENDVIAKLDTDFITRKNMRTLQPGDWLSDEIIHFYLALLAKRDEEFCSEDSTRKRCHFFKSFFMTKLLNEGHQDPNVAGTYEYKNVKRWSKKVPGKDIFALDKVFFPINVGDVHWTCACAFVQEKRIQYYDSFGGLGSQYLEKIKNYLQDEHQDKKKCPLPDSDDWILVPCDRSTPRQRNGFDCGVFTCMFADFLSKDCPLVFGQDHVNQCRERIALSILEGRAF